MISPKKEYLIKVFLKRAKYDHMFKSIFDYHFSLLIAHNKFVSNEAVEKIKKKYNYEKFFHRRTRRT